MKQISGDTIEGRIQQEIEKLNNEINNLIRQRNAYEAMLARVRREDANLRDVTRKNSISRIMIESRVMEMLGAEKRVSGADLYRDAKYADSRLNYSTFRTQLFRMKDKGMIENVDRGWWKLSQTNLGITC